MIMISKESMSFFTKKNANPIKHAKKHKLFAGVHNVSPEYAKEMIETGFNFVTVGSDQRHMSSEAKSVIEKMKGSKKGQDNKGY